MVFCSNIFNHQNYTLVYKNKITGKISVMVCIIPVLLTVIFSIEFQFLFLPYYEYKYVYNAIFLESITVRGNF